MSTVTVKYHWIVESESETCAYGCKIGPGEKALVLYFPKAYLALCETHGKGMQLS